MDALSSEYATWLQKLRALKPNVSLKKGPGNARFAPHKPLLLLSILGGAESGEITTPNLPKSPALRLRFDSYWTIVQPRWGGKPGLDLPFYHLSSQGFWSPRTADGAPAHRPESTRAVVLDPGFFESLLDHAWRDQARRILVGTWFPEPEQAGLYAALGLTDSKIKQLSGTVQETPPEYLSKGRDARFRVTVVTQYRFTCALTGHGLHTANGGTLVEAAHIHAFSKSRNDSPKNGLALRRDAHWMFDEFLWTVDEDFRVLLAEEAFTEWGPNPEWLKQRKGSPLVFADGVNLRPSLEHLAWHRSEAGKRWGKLSA